MTNVIEVEALSRRYGRTTALDNVSLSVAPGFVYGLVGANGHGKTTLIKHLLGLLRPQSGTVRVFGQDPIAQPVSVLERIGYLSENRELPAWMRIDELLRYIAAFHPKWDQAYANKLVEILQLDVRKKIKELSKGMRAQTALIAAAAHRPDLLLLDEPSTGLDAVVRRDILALTVRTAAEHGATVLFSSHLLDEVELMSDRLIMIDRGRITLEGELDTIRCSHWILTASLSAELSANLSELRRQSGIVSFEQSYSTCRIVGQGDYQAIKAHLERHDGRDIQLQSATLQDIFVARAGRDRVSVLDETSWEVASVG